MSFLRLYFSFIETSTLSNNVALLCKATLTTFASYSSGAAVTWCTANIDSFAATPFYQQKNLVSYIVTTPIVSTDTSSLTNANIALFNSTLWGLGFFAKETSLAAVTDVENASNDRVLYAVLMGFYTLVNMAFVVFLYYLLKGKLSCTDQGCAQPCSGDDFFEEEENAIKLEGFCCAYKGSILHGLYMIFNFAMIGAYCIIAVTDDNHIELKTPITVLEHLPILHVAVFRAFLF